MSEKAPFLVFSGTNSRYLAEKICASLNCPLGQMNITHFADGEFAVSYEESIRGANVFLVQSTFPNSDNLMELLLMVDAAKRASAKTINAVVPYFGWARQDRKDKPRVSIGAKLVADLLSVAGIDRLITMDLHADQIQGFFNIPVDHLYASAVFLPYIQSLNLEDLVIATPDVGGSKRASTFSKYLGVPLVLCNKSREKANVVASMQIIGDVKDKNVVLIDDIVDTAGTITKAADLIRQAGFIREEGIRAEFSDYQSNCIFTYEGCTSDEIFTLLCKTAEKVYETSGILLEPSITLLGSFRERWKELSQRYHQSSVLA